MHFECFFDANDNGGQIALVLAVGGLKAAIGGARSLI